MREEGQRVEGDRCTRKSRANQLQELQEPECHSTCHWHSSQQVQLRFPDHDMSVEVRERLGEDKNVHLRGNNTWPVEQEQEQGLSLQCRSVLVDGFPVVDSG